MAISIIRSRFYVTSTGYVSSLTRVTGLKVLQTNPLSFLVVYSIRLRKVNLLLLHIQKPRSNHDMYCQMRSNVRWIVLWSRERAGRQLSSYSRMMDLGGAPSNHKTTTRINASKNCKVQAVCFDFDVLTRSIVGQEETIKEASSLLKQTKSTQADLRAPVQPNVSMVQQVAELLNVNLGETSPARQSKDQEEDLSLLTGQANATPPKQSSSHLGDVRAKYAAKLSRKGVAGVAGVEQAKHQVEDSLKRGDAAGHLAARKMVAAEPVSTRWMAVTGTGALLQYLTQRSMKICLLPKPSSKENPEDIEQMEDFTKQLREVVFDTLVKDGSQPVHKILKSALDSLHSDPLHVLLVSDRDDYMRAGKDLGMVVCRIRPANARRGNVSAHYTASSVPDVKDVVDEINGISFNAVFKGR